MFQVPTLPTESLYKFLTIGSIVVMVTSTLLLITELQNLKIERIKFNTAIELYNHSIETNKSYIKDFKDQFKRDSLYYIDTDKKLILVQEEEKNKVIKSTYFIDGKNISLKDYRDYITGEYNKAVGIYNKKLDDIRDRSEKSIEVERIKLGEQEQLRSFNENSRILGIVIWSIFMIINTFSLKYGFIKWKEAQIITDKMLVLQVAKLEKEAAAEIKSESAASDQDTSEKAK